MLETSRTGFAPRAASVRRKINTFARYCALLTLQGVRVLAPCSSFSAITGLEHPIAFEAYV